MNKWIVATGNAFDGMSLYGPFDYEEALAFAETQKAPWEVVQVFPPETSGDQPDAGTQD